jgi:hypothetical protein
LNQMNPVHTLKIDFSKIYFNIILHQYLFLSDDQFSSGFINETVICTSVLSDGCYMFYQSHNFLVYHPNDL